MNRQRLLLGGVAAAAVIGATFSSVALAQPSAPPSPSASPTVAGKAGPVSSPTVDQRLSRAAAMLGVSTDRLLHALAAAKHAVTATGSPTGDVAAAAVAADLGV